MKQGTRRYCSAAEKDQAQRYIEFLQTVQHITNQKSLDAYKGAVTARGKLTEAARAAGLLKNGVESLLTMTDPAQVRAVRDWWVREGRSSYSGPQAHMGHWLAFQGAPPENRKIPERVLPQRLRVPSHGVRLRFLLQAFFADYKVTSVEKSMDLYARLLAPMAGQKGRFFCTTDSLKEYTANFRELRLLILAQTERSPEETAAAVAAAFPSGLERACWNIVVQVMEQHGCHLLEDLERRPVAYGNSLLPCLEGLHAACQTAGGETCAQALLPLVRAVLLDCDPAYQSGDASLTPGAALRDPCLWDGGLLWTWMDQKPLSAGAVEILLRLPFPGEERQWSHLSAVLLHSMLTLSERPNGHQKSSAWREEDWHEADRWLESAIVFCGKSWDILSSALVQPVAPWCEAVSEPHLLGGTKASLFHADLLCRQAELLLRMPVWDLSKARQNVRLIRAQSAAQTGAAIVKKRLADHQELLEALTGQRTARQTLARLCLCDAEAYRRLAALESEETCLTDVLDMYIRPCRVALSDVEAFILLSERAHIRLKSQRNQLCWDCYETFFGKNEPFVQRLRLLPETDDQSYQAEHAAWKECFCDLLPMRQSAPHIVLPLDPEALRDPEQFKPVYSGVFDSVLGKDPAQQKPAELAAFQLLGSSQTSLLQMNQVVDNLTALRLLHEPGFRTACREGIITLSCFLQVHSPELYLKQKLLDPGFRFSCSQAFALPKNIRELDADAQKRLIQRGARGVMLRYLEGKATLEDFPDECDRQEMAFLAESWKIAFDSFQPSDLRRYHQNDAYRYPPRKTAFQAPSVLSLPQMLQQRIGRLIREARQPGSAKDLRRLLAVRDWADRIGILRDRSAYDSAIDALLKQNPDPALEDLRSVVHQSYFLANGSLCCEHILLTERDPNFILLGQENGLRVTYESRTASPTTEYVYRQAWKPGTSENIGWPDLCEIALINRELALKSRGLSVDRQIADREVNTGLKYCEQGGDILVSDYTARLSTGERTHVCPAEAVALDTQFLEMQRGRNKND